MKYAIFIDSGFAGVPYESIMVNTTLDINDLRHICDVVTDRFKLIIRKYNKETDDIIVKNCTIEQALMIIKNFTFEFTRQETKEVKSYIKVEDGFLNYNKFKKHPICIKDGIAYYIKNDYKTVDVHYIVTNDSSDKGVKTIL